MKSNQIILLLAKLKARLIIEEIGKSEAAMHWTNVQIEFLKGELKREDLKGSFK